ncbi:MAG: porin [Chromatiales bacterium]|jgi:predicted porin|nr:porin [Chromatiales bacterium]
MKARLMTGCVLLALAALPAAASAIELYGQAHVSLDAVSSGSGDIDVDGNLVPAKKNSFLISSNRSFIGLRGREGVRDQWAVVWQYEQGVDLDDGSWSNDGRDSFVGLDSNLGTLLVGRHATPYRVLTDRLDIFIDTRADQSAVVGAVAGQSLFNEVSRNILYYTSPQDRRLRFSLAYIANRARDEMPHDAAQADLNGLSSTLIFDSGPLYFGLGYERLGQVDSPTQKAATAAKAALGWDFEQGTKVALIWEQADNGVRLVTGDESRAAWYASISHLTGNFTWKFAYGMLGKLDSTPDSGAQMIALGVSYAMSPRTELYLFSATMLNESRAAYALQPDHDDRGERGGSVLQPAAAGDNVTTISAGLIHRFNIGL